MTVVTLQMISTTEWILKARKILNSCHFGQNGLYFFASRFVQSLVRDADIYLAESNTSRSSEVFVFALDESGD